MKCHYCGNYSWGRYLCPDCHDRWKESRRAAYHQAVREIGELNAETKDAIVKRVRQLQKMEKEVLKDATT